MDGDFSWTERLAAAGRPLVMGIVNVTPDSFSDGGRFLATDAAVAHGRRLVAEGADLLDIGGESTRPGAVPVTIDDELGRVIPVIEGLADIGVTLSVDTTKPEVMAAAIAAGATVVNDVAALRTPGAVAVVARSQVGVVLMHMQGTPSTMQIDPSYGDVVADVASFLAERVSLCDDAGIARDRIAVDPGFGFGKRLEHNLALLARLDELSPPGVPVLVGLSRKSMFAGVSARPPGERVVPSVAAAVMAVERGARIVRVHDVAETCEALAVWRAVTDAGAARRATLEP